MENRNMNQAEAVIYFLQRLDVKMLSLILENHQYQYFEKDLFIKKLGEALQKFTEAGDTFLNISSGHCNLNICHFNCTGFTFIGNKSKNYMNLIIEIKDGIVQNISDCNYFKKDMDGITNDKIEINPGDFCFDLIF